MARRAAAAAVMIFLFSSDVHRYMLGIPAEYCSLSQYDTLYGMWVPSSGSEVGTSVGISHIPKGHVPVGKVVGMIIQGTHDRP